MNDQLHSQRKNLTEVRHDEQIERDRKPARNWAFAFAALLIVLFIGACISIAQSTPPPNTDPKVDWVDITNSEGTLTGVRKICDGTTLIYSDPSMFGSSITKVTNSPECK